MKDFAGKQHKRKQAHKASPKFKTAKKNISPINLRTGLIIIGAIAVFVLTVFKTMETDISSIYTQETKTTIEFTFPSDLEKNWVLAEIDEKLTTESCEYLLQVETYGKNIYAQEL